MSICEHGRLRTFCKECGGAGLCEHGRYRGRCKECRSGMVCEHGLPHTTCKECRGGAGSSPRLPKRPRECVEGVQWAQCDECGQWRRLQCGESVPTDDAWWDCSMVVGGSCVQPEDEESETELDEEEEYTCSVQRMGSSAFHVVDQRADAPSTVRPASAHQPSGCSQQNVEPSTIPTANLNTNASL